MAPEAMFCREFISSRLSPASDVFSFGITLLMATCKSSSLIPIRLQLGRAYGEYENSDSQNSKTLKTYYEQLNDYIKSCYPEDARSQFLCNLIQKCCSLNPADRPSAAQVAHCFVVFNSDIETDLKEKDKEILNFDKILKIAQKDCPKGIPLALREMLQSKNKTVCKKGCQAILNLGEVDSSYKQTPSYGLALLRSKGKSEFNQWASSMITQDYISAMDEIKSKHPNFRDSIKSLHKKIKECDTTINGLRKGKEKSIKNINESNVCDQMISKFLGQRNDYLKDYQPLKELEERLNQNPLYNLKNRITMEDIKEDGAVWDSKDIKVSQKE